MEKPASVGGNVVALGRGGFFAVDRRAWAHASRLGLNAAVAYLVLARGTGHDQRTTSWSVNAIETHTAIGTLRAKKAIETIVAAGLVRITRGGKRPRYHIVPAHEVPSCDGFPPSPVTLTPAEQALLDRLEYYGGCYNPGTDAARETAILNRLIWYGRLSRVDDLYYEIIDYNAEEAAKPLWIWLPNSLVTGVDGDLDPPLELLRQTQNPAALRLLVDLYGAGTLTEDGGVRWRHIHQTFKRHRMGEHGSFVVWGFLPGSVFASAESPVVRPHLMPDDAPNAWGTFWKAWETLENLGLVELVTHLIEGDGEDAAILAPYALFGTGEQFEREMAIAANAAASAMLNPARRKEAVGMLLAPVPAHIDGATMVGIARLRYRPRTARTTMWLARQDEWQAEALRLREAGRRALADWKALHPAG